MKRVFLCLLLAAPLGCSTTHPSWMAEFDKDPDLQINIWDKGCDVEKAKATGDSAKE